MRLAKSIKTIANEDETIAGYITALPVNGCVYIITKVSPEYKEEVYSAHEVPVDDLNSFSQDVIYRLIKRARNKNNET